MKTKICFFIFLVSNVIFGQGPLNSVAAISSYKEPNSPLTQQKPAIDANGFDFELLEADVNSESSDAGSGSFRNKFIMVSSKKIGGLAKTDPNTGEAYKELFCLDMDADGNLSTPVLFSRILNTNGNEDQLTFSPDEKTVYFTRSTKENSKEYKLYKATLEDNSHGNWNDSQLLSINKDNVSIETPYVDRQGNKLYFSANLPDAIGGFDLYVSDINPDGTLSEPVNLGNTINTTSDDKYPSLSTDGKYLYFSSQGHENLGGYDVFVSKITNNGLKSPRNIGNTINTPYDEIAFFLMSNDKGYVSSNRPNGEGNFDIYTAVNNKIIQNIKGKVLDQVTQIKLPNTLVVLKDEDGIEIAKTYTDEDGMFDFGVEPFEVYTISTYKDGFHDLTLDFFANKGNVTTYNQDIELMTTEPVISKFDDETRIVLENIYFDFDKYSIKEESTISLNKVVKVLNDHPEMTLEIHAHADNKGPDSYNLELSNKRAKSTVKYLIENGIDQIRLQPKGFGESKPLIDCENNCSEEDLQTNRRVEFIVLEKVED